MHTLPKNAAPATPALNRFSELIRVDGAEIAFYGSPLRHVVHVREDCDRGGIEYAVACFTRGIRRNDCRAMFRHYDPSDATTDLAGSEKMLRIEKMLRSEKMSRSEKMLLWNEKMLFWW
jgi:hypothetical protein